MKKEVADIAKLIDHSILHPTHTDEDLIRECENAKTYQAASVCVKPYGVKIAAEILEGSGIPVGCVIGFPAGNSAIEVKVFETEQAIRDGAIEIDMVINIGKALAGDWTYIEEEIGSVTDACHRNGAIVKVIFETDYVTGEQDKIKLCEICSKVGADYVKTSTGFGFVKQADGSMKAQGATIENLKLMREHSAPGVKVKASGGIRSLDEVLALRDAGADRIGASGTGAILEEAAQRFG
ncbi:deoxyribose-phosphate aldolase [Balneolales bacterium ANBcel1]|nr:deoxyribose-phosphate aldolase [Balneolales bacterium ANBcel1]